LSCAAPGPGSRRGGQARGGAVGHPFAAQCRRHGALRQKVRGGRDQSNGAITPSRLGDHDCHDLRPPRHLAGSRRCGSSGEAADVVVAQAVEHQDDQLAGGGHHTDVAATTGGDPVAVLPEAGVRGHALHGLDRGPAHQPAALLGRLLHVAAHRVAEGPALSVEQGDAVDDGFAGLAVSDVADYGADLVELQRCCRIAVYRIKAPPGGGARDRLRGPAASLPLTPARSRSAGPA